MTLRPAVSLYFSLLLSGAALAAPNNHPAPTLLLPTDGAVVGRQILVQIGFSGKGPQGLAEGTGIGLDALPVDQLLRNVEPVSDALGAAHSGPADGTGLVQSADLRPRGPHFAILIDAPAPQPGDPFQPDSHHVPFPIGNPQMMLTLPPGPHQLSLVRLNGDGQVSRRYREQASTSITVRQ